MSVNVVEDADYFDFDSDATIPTSKLPPGSSGNIFTRFATFFTENYPNTCWAGKVFFYTALCIRITPVLVHLASPFTTRLLGN
jgi:hypothetical protein